ncbi:putative F-box protein SKIP23-like [Capsicum annuum]|nr:putative F-box protein SKIP23-like [Capsicum annuum]
MIMLLTYQVVSGPGETWHGLLANLQLQHRVAVGSAQLTAGNTHNLLNNTDPEYLNGKFLISSNSRKSKRLDTKITFITCQIFTAHFISGLLWLIGPNTLLGPRELTGVMDLTTHFKLLPYFHQEDVQRVHLLNDTIGGVLLKELFQRDGVGMMVARYMYLVPVYALDPCAHRDRESALVSLGSGNELVKYLHYSERGRKVIKVMGKRVYDLKTKSVIIVDAPASEGNMVIENGDSLSEKVEERNDESAKVRFNLIQFDQIRDVNINVPMEPEVGLYLDECFFTSYNSKWKDPHEEVSLTAYSEMAEEFKMKHIYSHIALMEHKEGRMGVWLHSLNHRNYPDLCVVDLVKPTDDGSKVVEIAIDASLGVVNNCEITNNVNSTGAGDDSDANLGSINNGERTDNVNSVGAGAGSEVVKTVIEADLVVINNGESSDATNSEAGRDADSVDSLAIMLCQTTLCIS